MRALRPYAAYALACFVAGCGTLVAVKANDGGVAGGDDAGGDAPPVVVDGGEPGCDARFCSDFDPPFDKPPFEWADASGVDFLSATSTFSLSPPNALAIVTSSSDPLRFVVEPVAGWALPLRVDFSVRVEATSGSGALLHILRVKCGAAEVTVKVGPAGSWFLHVTADQMAVTALPLHTWQPISLELRTDATTLTTPTGTSTDAPCASPQEVHLGSVDFLSTSDTGIYDVRIDRVRIR